MASRLVKNITDAIMTSTIYAAFVHGDTDVENPTYQTVPPNTYVFELAEVGEVVFTSIDEPLWGLIQDRNRLAASITGEDTSEATAKILRNIIMYGPGDRYCVRNLELGEKERNLPSWGFFKHNPGDTLSYLEKPPYIQFSDLSILKYFYYDKRLGSSINTDTDFIKHVNAYDKTNVKIIFINACSAIQKKTLSPQERKNLTAIQRLQQAQWQYLAENGLQLGSFVHTSETVPNSKMNQTPMRYRGKSFIPFNSEFRGFTKGQKVLNNNTGIHSVNNNFPEKTFCQKCMNAMGKVICCKRRGGRTRRLLKKNRRTMRK
uniref:Uncharacterized protein n=1 Tax=viral metagenome TaxID=1070528 RepID=A0A6C0DK34_9ZZZZ